MAQKNEVLILAGCRRKKTGVFISHFAAGPGGILGVYRKIHLGTPEEGIYQAGKECPLFRYRGSHFGMELCFDGHFPELSTASGAKRRGNYFYSPCFTAGVGGRETGKVAPLSLGQGV